MKKISLLFLSLIGSVIAFAQTAPNYIGNDCSGAPHDLYTEMDAGKVLVVCFVAPSAASVGPALAAQSTVQGYASSHPGRVLFYLADDNGDTPCMDLASWASAAGVDRATLFSNSAFRQADYPGLSVANPKIVVMGGASHHIYHYQDYTINTPGLQAGINDGLATTAVQLPGSIISGINVSPNPATENTAITYTLTGSADVAIGIYSLVGQKVGSVAIANQSAGNHIVPLGICKDLSNGIYFAKISTGESSAALKFIVDK